MHNHFFNSIVAIRIALAGKKAKGMFMSVQNLEDYLLFLKEKGFHLQDDALGFIYFGKHSTNASDQLVNLAIEITIKTQKRFDGSFYVSLLELLKENKIERREEAMEFVKERGLLS